MAQTLEEVVRTGKPILRLNPHVLRLPLAIQRYDDPFLPYGKAIVGATRDIVGAYMFDLASYLALGGAGAVALERTVDYVGGDIVTILHGAFSAPEYVVLCDVLSFGVDYITVTDSVQGSKNSLLWTQREGLAVTHWHYPSDRVWANGTSTSVTDEGFLGRWRGENFADAIRGALSG
jgi:hypothetical protein